MNLRRGNETLNSDSHLPKKLFYFLQWKPFKMLKNAFRSQDI